MEYPVLSPYVYVNNDPLFFVDPNGKELYIFGEDEESRKKAFELLQQFVGEGADRLTLGENGRVLINTEDYKYGSNKALDLLIDIDQAVDAEGNTIKIGFGVSTKEISPEDISANNEVRGGGIVNASVTPRAGVGPDRRPDLPLGYPPGPKPIHGFQGEVTISTHVEWSINGKPIARSQIVGHELSENLYRTRDKLNYWVAHAIANLKFFSVVIFEEESQQDLSDNCLSIGIDNKFPIKGVDMIYWAYSNFKNFVAKTFFVFFDNIKVGSENSKLFINILLVLFINIAIANIYAQSVGNRVVKYSLNNLIFSADLPDFIYSYNDTVNIQYSVINHSKMTVYIFDPTQYYSPATVEPGYDSTYCLYKYKLGGSWFYNLGYINELKLTKIEPDSKYEYTFRLILQRKSQKQRCLYGLAPSREPEGLISRQVTFDIGFIPTSDSLRLKSLNKGYVDFESVKDVIYFEGHLRRFFLGPLWFRIKDQ